MTPLSSIIFVARAGDDLSDGAAPSRPKRTIQAAVDALGPVAGGTVQVDRGEFVESVTLPQGVRLVGQGGLPASGGTTKIKAPNDTAHCIVASAPVFIENIATQGSSAAWVGHGIHLDRAHHSRILNWRHQNGDGWGAGTGLYMTNTEGALIMGAYTQECGVGVHLANEGTENVFIDYRAAANEQHLVIDGNAGGNLFNHCKFTYGRAPVSVVVGGGGSNVFMVADWDESPDWPDISISSDHNVFTAGASAPESQMTVTGSHNIFDGWRVLGVAIDVGARNEWRKPRVIHGSLDLSGATDAVIAGERNQSGALAYGTARRPVYEPASLNAP